MTTLNLYTLWQALMSEVNVQQNGQIRPVEDFIPWLIKSQNNLFRKRIATDETAQMYADDLIPFKKTYNIAITPLPGMPYDLARYPSDYEFFVNMRILRHKDSQECACDTQYPLIKQDGTCVGIKDPDYAEMEQRFMGANLVDVTVNKIETQRWPSCMTHVTKGPTFNEPKCTQATAGINIAPKGITSVILDYYRTPTVPVFAYTLGAGDIVVYDPVNSVQLEWGNTLWGEFMDELKKIYAAHVGDTTMYQMADKDGSSIV